MSRFTCADCHHVLTEADFSRTQFAKANGSKRCTQCVLSAEQRKRKRKRTRKSPSSKAHGQGRAQNTPRWCDNCQGWYRVLCGGCDVAAPEEESRQEADEAAYSAAAVKTTLVVPLQLKIGGEQVNIHAAIKDLCEFLA